jgi:hypothetical protein
MEGLHTMRVVSKLLLLTALLASGCTTYVDRPAQTPVVVQQPAAVMQVPSAPVLVRPVY